MKTIHGLLLTLILLGGTLVPPSLYANDYLLFATAMGGTKAQIYQMDGGGTLGLREERTTGIDVHNVSVSPDRRMVVAGAETTPTLSVFFIKDDGSLAKPQYLTPPLMTAWTWMPVAFHDTLPLFFAGNVTSFGGVTPTMISLEYDRRTERVEPTGKSIALKNYGGTFFSYSPWAKSLIFQAETDTGHPLNAIQSLQINDDGGFGKINPLYQLPGRVILDGFTVSPDGRWAAAIISGDPMKGITPVFLLLAIGKDGTFSLADRFDSESGQDWFSIPVCFTPDSRRLLIFGPGDAFLKQYDINSQTGRLTKCNENDWNWDDMGGEMSLPMCLTVTPDGRYAAFRSAKDYPPDAQHNWIHVVRLNEDGTTTYLPDKRIEVDHYIGAMAFATLPPKNATGPEWTLYE